MESTITAMAPVTAVRACSPVFINGVLLHSGVSFAYWPTGDRHANNTCMPSSPPPSPAVTATLINADCFEAFRTVEDNSVDAVITDPPYFLDRLGSGWDVAEMKKTSAKAVVTSLPVGMKFDARQGRVFQEFMVEVSRECARVLKPGGFFLAFSAPRLYHRLGVAVEDAGFEVRDMWAWIYTQNQVKAMSVARFVDPTRVSPEDLERLDAELEVWKTPQVKSCVEPIVFAQKPKLDAQGKPVTFLDNWLTHHVGLVNVRTGVGADGSMVTANVMTSGPIDAAFDKAFLVSKPTKAEKGETSHISVKPLALMEQLVTATVPEGGLVLDPFNGSGSTGIAAVGVRRNYVGFELAPDYFEQAKQRFASAFSGEGFTWGTYGNTVSGRLPG